MTLRRFWASRRFWKQAMTLALPIAFQNLLTSSFTLVDTLLVGRLGGYSLTAVGMAGQWSWLMSMFIFGTCSGLAVFVSQYWGSKEISGIYRVFGIGLMTGAVIVTPFFLSGLLCPQAVLHIFTDEEPVIELGAQYLRVLAWSFPAMMLGYIFNTQLRSTERVRLPMWTSLITTLCNVVLDIALIFGRWGFPEMGIRGAALATVIAAWLGPVITYVVSLCQHNMLIASPKAMFRFTKTSLADFYRRALPVIGNEGLWGFGTMLYNVILGHLGADNFAALTVLRTFDNIAFVFFVGFGNAACVMIGKEVGAGKIRYAIEDARRFSVITPIIGVIVGLTVILFRAPLIGIFNVNDAVINMDTAMAIMLIYGVELPIREIPYIQIVGIFRSGGDTRTAALYDLISLYGIALPLVALSAFVFKWPFAVCFALMYAGEDYIKAFLCIRHFKRLAWLRPVTEEGQRGLKVYKETGDNL